MKTIRVFTLTTMFALVALALTGVATAPSAAAATSPEQAYARDVAMFINQERAARGLAPVSWTFSETLRSHMATTCLTHSSQNDGLEMITCVYPNAGQPGGAAGGAVYKWMQSSSHGPGLMYPASSWIKVGVFCDSSGIAHVAVVVEDDWDNPIPPHTGPSSDYYLAGAQCPGPKPAVTAPPPTAPATPPAPVVTPAPVAPSPRPGTPSTPGGVHGSTPATPTGSSSTPAAPTGRKGTSGAPTKGGAASASKSDPDTLGGDATVTPTRSGLRDPDPPLPTRDTARESEDAAPGATVAGRIPGATAERSSTRDTSRSGLPSGLLAGGVAVLAASGFGVTVLRRRLRPVAVEP